MLCTRTKRACFGTSPTISIIRFELRITSGSQLTFALRHLLKSRHPSASHMLRPCYVFGITVARLWLSRYSTHSSLRKYNLDFSLRIQSAAKAAVRLVFFRTGGAVDYTLRSRSQLVGRYRHLLVVEQPHTAQASSLVAMLLVSERSSSSSSSLSGKPGSFSYAAQVEMSTSTLSIVFQSL